MHAVHEEARPMNQVKPLVDGTLLHGMIAEAPPISSSPGNDRTLVVVNAHRHCFHVLCGRAPSTIRSNPLVKFLLGQDPGILIIPLDNDVR